MRFRRIYLIIAVLTSLFANPSCDSDSADPRIPYRFFEVQVDPRSVLFPGLQRDGGFAYISQAEAGYKGLIIYRESANVFRAFDRACTFDTFEDCALLQVDVSELFIIDKCCNSTFDFNGMNTGGPANLPLFEYKTRMEAGVLIVSSD